MMLMLRGMGSDLRKFWGSIDSLSPHYTARASMTVVSLPLDVRRPSARRGECSRFVNWGATRVCP
jgi:hypothetical protein